MASTTCGSASQAVEPSLLYSRNVPVKLSLASRDDRTELLTVRITLSAASATCAKTLRVHITSEEDAFFLHSLEVSEEDLLTEKLAHEDRLRVVLDYEWPLKVLAWELPRRHRYELTATSLQI